MLNRKINGEFFNYSSDRVARELLGKILVRKIRGKLFRARIVETEAYFGEEDPASWARHGKRRDNFVMWYKPGTILIKNVHKYQMLNFVTGKHGEASAVLIRALEPINFDARLCGPGLLTLFLRITKQFNGKHVETNDELWVEDPSGSEKIELDILESYRIGVVKDLDKKLRFYIKGNTCVSRK